MNNMDYNLLRELCAIRAASGDERKMTDFILDHIEKEKNGWKCQPVIHHGADFQDCIVLVFGSPRTAIYTHIDSIGFTVRYDNEIVRIGAPHLHSGYQLVGSDSMGEIECELEVDEDRTASCRFSRTIDRGTNLTYRPDWRETADHVQCCYLDNRLGVAMTLELCKNIEHGAVVFSCWEEHGGGSVSFLAKFLYDHFRIKQSLICDITWVTEGVPAGAGAVISLRDSGLPRRSFVDRIIGIASQAGFKYQLEVESAGGSDGTELQKQPYPIDWCFIGPPEENAHTPDEKVNKADIEQTLLLYGELMQRL